MPDKFSKFILFSLTGDGLSHAYHLQREGNEVLVAIVEDVQEAMEKELEEPELKKMRLSQYDGLLNKFSTEKLFSMMEKFENKEEWFVIFDFNSLFKFSDRALKMGFTNGLFPSKVDYILEADRDLAKRFVQKNYPGLKTAEVEEFKLIDDGIEFINESDEFWALKGNDPAGTTVVPRSRSIENCRETLIDALHAKKEDYERMGYILERQIRDGLEVCPQMVYYNGERVASCVDFEDKAFSSTDDSEMFGCALNIIMDTPLECELNQIAFPEAIDKLAKKHKGLFYIDANLIIKDGDFYFLEFCSNRMGYDASFAEAEMSGESGAYFNALAHGENPYKRRFGVGTRGFAMKRTDDGMVRGDIAYRYPEELWRHLWMYSAKKEGDRIMNIENPAIDLVAITESSDDLEYAKIKLFDVLKKFSFSGMYARIDFDCLCQRVNDIEKFVTPSG